jgi:alpha-beta hydrolase superfamily lysophospholipase
MERLLLSGTVAVACACSGCFIAERESTRLTFVNSRQVTVTPGDFGAPFTETRIPVSTRVLDSFVVTAPGAHEAVFICHGVDETVSNWARTQKLLFDQGMSSMVFDYSAYGRSTGEPAVENLREDAAAAYRRFTELFGGDTRRYVLALSLGVSVCLAAYPDLSPAPSGIVLTGTWSSTREIAVALGAAPGFLSWIVPQTFDNVIAIQRVGVPLLMVQGGADEAVPFEQAQKVFAAARAPKTLVVPPGIDHNAPWDSTSAAYWSPILAFMKTPGAT